MTLQRKPSSPIKAEKPGLFEALRITKVLAPPEGASRPVQTLAKKNFELLKANPRHPSLRFKRVGDLYSARVGIAHRALVIEGLDGPIWFWIGDHSVYDMLTG